MRSSSERRPEAEEQTQVISERRAGLLAQKAKFYDRIVHRPEAAFRAYQSLVRKFPESEWTEEAEKRLDELAKVIKEKQDAEEL